MVEAKGKSDDYLLLSNIRIGLIAYYASLAYLPSVHN